MNSGSFKEDEIIFRQINECVPCGCVGGSLWYVEFHLDHRNPAWLATVIVSPDGFVTLCMVFVVDMERRKGIATKLVAACREQWPSIHITAPVSDAGKGLRGRLPAIDGDRGVRTTVNLDFGIPETVGVT